MSLSLRYLDPRRSLAATIGWLVLVLSLGLALVASAWVGGIVRSDLLDLRGRQLDRTADRLVADLNLNLSLRVRSVGALAVMLGAELRDDNQTLLHRILGNLQQASPELETIALANPQGRVLVATDRSLEGSNVADREWFVLGWQGAKKGEVRLLPMLKQTPSGVASGVPGSFVGLIAAVVDDQGETVGLVGTRLSVLWLLDFAESLQEELRGTAGTQALLLDRDGVVLIGTEGLKGKRLAIPGDSPTSAAPALAGKVTGNSAAHPARIERLADGKRYLVARASPASDDALNVLGWRVVVLQPVQDAGQDDRLLQIQITAVLLGLGALAALLGVFLARRVTRDLDAIARSADTVRRGATQQISVPPGNSEAARLGRALNELLGSLQRERAALQTLNAELDQRVIARTREVERLAEQERYAAVVRERLKIARDLHDTLAHSMMAMLSEVRLLKRLWSSQPAAMAEELVRAEKAAHEGLQEARAAITAMRFNPVRDVGLAAALDDFLGRFAERTGITVDYTSDASSGTFADERAETLFRIAEEALRNVERHAGATRVTVSLGIHPGSGGATLAISDNGLGFDADATYPGHYGLAGLREQATLIGAELTVSSVARQGTTISVALPNGHDTWRHPKS
ncbi:MAG: histidine kinase [Candidatus Accumulibacter phosphatis]|uniref:histidine kinase n=1 Tax=Candidatus Accumulibacter phosphatis TaxID=327160 RepID=A0A6A7RRG8_9PROT|nr:histidine kinase [Candidatus Accumulibacter phosphatis]